MQPLKNPKAMSAAFQQGARGDAVDVWQDDAWVPGSIADMGTLNGARRWVWVHTATGMRTLRADEQWAIRFRDQD